MNAFAFGLKRAFHSTLRITRSVVASFGLTAARFDMLFALRRTCARAECRGFCCRVMQRDLRRLLGVSAPTISRMLRALERMGLVRRERCDMDGRQLRVFLTEQGRSRIDRAYSEIDCSGALELAFECALSPSSAPGEHWPLGGQRFEDLSVAEDVLTKIRRGFRDRATLHYPWHPDD